MFYEGSVTEAMRQSHRTFFPLLIFVVDPKSPQQELQHVEALIRTSSLSSTAILHLLLVGTPDYAQFQAASPTGAGAAVTPRVHIFPPVARKLPPYVLAGLEDCVADKVAEAVATAIVLQDTVLKEVQSQGLHAAKLDKAEREAASYRQAVTNAQQQMSPTKATTPNKATLSNNNNNNNATARAEDRAPTPVSKPAVPRAATTAVAESDIVCDGDVCRPRSAVQQKQPSPPPTAADVPVAPPTTAASPNTASSPNSAASSSSGTIDVRCTLPDGANVVASGLTAATSTLQDVARVVEAHVGTDAFSLSNAYPPRRFKQEEWSQPLAALGITRSTTLRVTMMTSLGTSGGNTAPAPVPVPAAGGGGWGGALGALSSWMRPGSAGGAAEQPPSSTEPPRTLPGVVRPTMRGGVATLSSIRQSEEEEDKKKPQSYYGGNSTEFQDGPK